MTLNWSLMDVGPGGNVIGINFADDGKAVCRTDTGGAYINSIASPVWQELITLSSMPSPAATIMGNFASGGVAFGGAYAVAVAPSNSAVVYLFTCNGDIFVSSNGGSSFSATGFTTVSIQVNGATDSSWNNKLAVDPQNAAVVLAGCPGGTFYNITSGSGAWTQIAGVGTGTFGSLIAFDRSSAVSGGKQQGIYIGTYGTGIYHSTTGHAGTFTLLNSAGMPTLPKQLRVAYDGTVYVVANDGTNNIYKYTGGAWSTLNPLPAFAGSLTLQDVVIDPADSTRVIAVFLTGVLSESTDHGATWSGPSVSPEIFTSGGDVPWLSTINHANLSCSGAAFNPALTNTLVAVDGVSVWKTNPYVLSSTSSYTIGGSGNTSFAVTSNQTIPTIGVGDPINIKEISTNTNIAAGTVVSYTPSTATSGTLVINITFSSGTGTHTDWYIRTGQHYASQGAGINQLVSTVITIPPGGKPFFACWDRCGFYLASATSFPANQAFVNPGGLTEIIGGWSADYSATTPAYLAGIFNSNISALDISGYSTDGGLTWTSFAANTPYSATACIGGSIAVAATASALASGQNIVWAPSYRGGSANRPYYSLDGGATWALCSFPVGVPTTVPTGWGSFGGALALRTICADRVARNTFYAWNSVTGLVYRSTDGGANFSRILVASSVSSAGVNILKAMPQSGTTNTTGWLFGWTLGVASDILNRSKDSGATWTVVDSTFTCIAAVGFGATVNGAVPAVMVVGIKSGVRGVWLSTDDCATWTNATANFFSSDQIMDLEGDKSTTGIWYVASENTGIYLGSDAVAPAAGGMDFRIVGLATSEW